MWNVRAPAAESTRKCQSGGQRMSARKFTRNGTWKTFFWGVSAGSGKLKQTIRVISSDVEHLCDSTRKLMSSLIVSNDTPGFGIFKLNYADISEPILLGNVKRVLVDVSDLKWAFTENFVSFCLYLIFSFVAIFSWQKPYCSVVHFSN